MSMCFIAGEAITAVGIWKLFGSQAENWYLGLFPLTAFGTHSIMWSCVDHDLSRLTYPWSCNIHCFDVTALSPNRRLICFALTWYGTHIICIPLFAEFTFAWSFYIKHELLMLNLFNIYVYPFPNWAWY